MFQLQYLYKKFLVQDKVEIYIIHSTKNIVSSVKNVLKSSRTQYQVIKEPKIGRNQKVFRNENDDLEVKNYPNTESLLRNQNMMLNVLVVSKFDLKSLMKNILVKIFNLLLI